MTQQKPLDFSIIRKAGIEVAAFARLVGVSRLTVYHWMQGNSPKASRRQDVGALLERIEAADRKGTLPKRKSRATAEDHLAALREVLAV